MLQGWKTLIFGVGVAVVGVLQTFDFSTVISDPKVVGYITTGIGVVVIVLRTLTSTPVGTSK